MVQLVDIFAKPEICLLREIVQWFHDHNIKFVPEAVFMDVQDSVGQAHPKFHAGVSEVTLLIHAAFLIPWFLMIRIPTSS